MEKLHNRFSTCCHLIVEGETKARQDIMTKMNMKVRLEVDKGGKPPRSKTLGSDMKTPAEEIASAALRGGMMALHPEKVRERGDRREPGEEVNKGQEGSKEEESRLTSREAEVTRKVTCQKGWYFHVHMT